MYRGRGLGDEQVTTKIYFGGEAPSPETDPNSINLDFSQGFAVAPGAAGSSTYAGSIPGYSAVDASPATQQSFFSRNSNLIIIVGVGLLALMVLGPRTR